MRKRKLHVLCAKTKNTYFVHFIGVTDQWDSCLDDALERIKDQIDVHKPYSLIIDETPDRWDDLSVTNVLYSDDPTQQPKTLEITFREVSQDNEGVTKIVFDARDIYQLSADKCSAR